MWIQMYLKKHDGHGCNVFDRISARLRLNRVKTRTNTSTITTIVRQQANAIGLSCYVLLLLLHNKSSLVRSILAVTMQSSCITNLLTAASSFFIYKLNISRTTIIPHVEDSQAKFIQGRLEYYFLQTKRLHRGAACVGSSVTGCYLSLSQHRWNRTIIKGFLPVTTQSFYCIQGRHD